MIVVTTLIKLELQSHTLRKKTYSNYEVLLVLNSDFLASFSSTQLVKRRE